MAIIFNQDEIAAEPAGAGARRQHLLTGARVSGTAILLDRIALDAGGEMTLFVPGGSVAWLQGLDGQALLKHAGGDAVVSKAQVAVLAPGSSVTLRAAHGATLLYGETPNAARLDPAFAQNPPAFRIADWTREPVLDSEHDARKRIYLVTPKLFGTKAVKGEMIIYPPGTAAANHHHEGAEHFMYVLRGRGTVYANEKPFSVRAGDIIYYPDRERHYLEAARDEELIFAEFFAPAEFRTVWVDESQVCTWLPTGRDIEGRLPVREIAAHSSAHVTNPQDVYCSGRKFEFVVLDFAPHERRLSLVPCWRGGLDASTGSKGRVDRCVVRSARDGAATTRTVRRARPARVASVRQDPISAAPCELS
jgi:quercetin dioxygenase-like cupin family protein